jgi:hypothetical protein
MDRKTYFALRRVYIDLLHLEPERFLIEDIEPKDVHTIGAWLDEVAKDYEGSDATE